LSASIHSINQHVACIRHQQGRYQPQKRAFPRAIGTNQSTDSGFQVYGNTVDGANLTAPTIIKRFNHRIET
jgi:hypothetical protein